MNAARTTNAGEPAPRQPDADSDAGVPAPGALAGSPLSALAAERARVAAALASAVITAPGPMTYGSQAAAASQVFEQQRELALDAHARQHLAAVDAALARVAAGTYGRCTACGGAVGDERLGALPWAELCIDCQRASRRR